VSRHVDRQQNAPHSDVHVRVSWPLHVAMQKWRPHSTHVCCHLPVLSMPPGSLTEPKLSVLVPLQAS
jgi:hypothetical protein